MHSETVISDSYSQLVHDAGITVMGYHLTTKPGGSVSITIRTAPAAAGEILIDYGKLSDSFTDYADEEGYITFNWQVPSSVAPRVYPVEIKTYIREVRLSLQVMTSNASATQTNSSAVNATSSSNSVSNRT